MAKAMTAKGVEAIKPDPSKRLELPDPALGGLYLVVQKTGAKSWALRYRFAGKPAKLTIGTYPALGLADARAAAGVALDAIERGIDPAAEKQAKKGAILEAQLSDRDKITTLITDFDKRHLSGLKSGKQARAFLDRFVVKAWGGRKIQDITRRDVIELLDGIADAGLGVTSNRVLAHMRKFFSWAIERDIIGMSPCTGVKPPVREVSRDRVLTDAEVVLFWRACDAVGWPWGPLAKMLLLTGQRLKEVAQMTRDEVNGAEWHLPGTRTKNKRAHIVALSDSALQVLADCHRIEGSTFVFTTTGKTAVSGFHKAHGAIAAAMERLASNDAQVEVKIPQWGFHDLRRTAATGMARLGIAVRVTEATLNHVSGTGGGIVSVYQRHDYADEKAAALEAWARYVATLVTGQGADNVVRLEARANG